MAKKERKKRDIYFYITTEATPTFDIYVLTQAYIQDKKTVRFVGSYVDYSDEYWNDRMQMKNFLNSTKTKNFIVCCMNMKTISDNMDEVHKFEELIKAMGGSVKFSMETAAEQNKRDIENIKRKQERLNAN